MLVEENEHPGADRHKIINISSDNQSGFTVQAMNKIQNLPYE